MTVSGVATLAILEGAHGHPLPYAHVCLLLINHLMARCSTGGAHDALMQLTSALMNFFKFKHNLTSP
jgi:hypothetical protein